MPATVVIEKSPLNTVRFVPRELVQSDAFHTIHEGDAHHITALLPGVFKQDYYYPAQISDIIDLQFHISTINGLAVELQLIDDTETVYHSWAYSSAVLLTNNTWIVDGISRMLSTYHFNISMADYPQISRGVWYLRLKVRYSKNNDGVIDTTVYQLSEPIDVRQMHPRTVLFTVGNNTNDYDTVFLQTSATFSHRLRGAIHHPAYESVDNIAVNSRQAPRKVYGYPGEVITLTVGGGCGVPDWVKRWCNYALVCDTIRFDDRSIVKDSGGSKWESISADPAYPLGGMSLSVRYADPALPNVNIVRYPLVLVKRPATGFPYFVHTIGLSDSLSLLPARTLGTGYYIRNAADEKAMKQKASAAVSRLRINGYVALVGDELRFYNNVQWGYDTSDSIVLPYVLLVTQNLAISTSASISAAGDHAGIVWDANTYSALTLGMGGPVAINHTYSGTGTATALLFHDNSLTQLLIGEAAQTSISGTGSSAFTSFIVSGTGITSFDCSVLQPAWNTLQFLDMSFNALLSVSNTSVLALGAPNGDGFTALNTVLFNNNNLNVSSVNNLLADVDQMVYNTSGINGGTMSTQDQAPSAAPTVGPPDGITAKADLVTNYFWTVNTD